MKHSRSEPRRIRRAVAGVFAIALVLGLGLPTLGARTQSNLVLIRSDDVIAEDLYAAGNDIQIDGVIQGDLVASAFDEIVITGRVEGSVLAIASRVVISGEVTGSVRAATPELEVSGTVGGDVFTAAWNARVEPEAQIGRDVLLWAWNAVSVGEIGRNVEGQQRSLEVGGVVAGDVEVSVSRLTILPASRFEGDVVYTSDEDATVDASADIAGNVVRETTLPVNVRVRAIGILASVLSVIATVALGLAIVWASPDRTARAAEVLRTRPWSVAGWGLSVLAVPIVIGVGLAVVVSLSPREAGLPLLGAFLPVMLGMVSLIGVAALTTPVPVATFVGRRFGRERSVYASFMSGVALLVVVRFIPWLGGASILIVVVLGLGAWVLSGASDVGPQVPDPEPPAQDTDVETGV